MYCFPPELEQVDMFIDSTMTGFILPSILHKYANFILYFSLISFVDKRSNKFVSSGS